MRGDRPSLTAAMVAAIRAFYTAQPPPYSRAPDPLAIELVPAWLSLPARAAARYPAAAPALRRFFDAAGLGLIRNVALRTAAIDDALRAGIVAGARQLVLLGAGLDARAHRLAELAGVRVLEVDHPSTHRYKAARLRAVRPAGEAVRVPIDFERDQLGEVLLGAGYDAAIPAFWVWEGVTVYLSRDAIRATLRALGDLSAPGSRLAVTYTRPGARRLAALEPLAHAAAALVGEPLRGMIPTADLVALLAEAGFAPLSDESAHDWAPRYWPGDPPRGDEWERLLVAERRR
jgi:methyltransferase (TIGR00027 family)